MSFWDTLDRWDNELHGEVSVRGPYEAMRRKPGMPREGFEVSFPMGTLPEAFTVAHPTEGEVTYRREVTCE